VNGKIRVLVVDDSLVMQKALGMVFAREHDMTVIGYATSGEEAERLIDQLRPEVVTIDIGLPGLDGLGLLDHLRKGRCRSRTVILSSTVTAAKDAVRRGAFGFFDKRRVLSDAAELIALVRHAAGGHGLAS
jgi:two-component system chemotaxis response regulator CheB